MLVLVCGPPGVGKTTVTERVRDRLSDRGHEFRVLHSDDFSSRTYERMYERVAGSDANWLVDGTFYKRAWQERFAALDPFVVYLRAPLETCLARNRARAEPIRERGVQVVHGEFHAPDADLTLDTTRYGPDEAADRVVDAVLDRL